MPAQKRVYENGDGGGGDRGRGDEEEEESSGREEEEEAEEKEVEEEEDEEDGDDGEDSDQAADSSSRSSSSEENEADEFILVRLSDIRKEVQCPICLGIIKKTRTVMECLHRFCRECIDKSMRLGYVSGLDLISEFIFWNNECPACRTHCASRRSLRDDPNYDALIAALYPDIDQYEEEELAIHEEEKARNRQIQASIAQTFKRQSEALSKKRRRSQGSTRRRRRNYHSEDDDDNVNANNGKESSSADEHPAEVRMRKPKRWRGQSSSAAGSADAAGDENDSELNRESGIGSGGLAGTSEMLVWGRGGMRSHTRYGSGSGGSGIHPKNSPIAKLVDHLRNLDENESELDIHLLLISLDEQKLPGLGCPYLCCNPALSVRHLCEYISSQTSLRAEEIEILAVRELQPNLAAETSVEAQSADSTVLDECKDEFQHLDLQETLTQVKAKGACSRGYLTLAYRQRQL
ncbi:putative E3 ubiquitin-protein ligase RING1a [Drosera capensis]